MSLAIVYSRASNGIAAPLVTVEAHLSMGLPKFNIVGLPETAVKESKDRVRSALINSGFEFPIKHITVNLAPADLPKEGGRFDLPIALGILAASRQIPLTLLSENEFTGELALTGEVRPVYGVLPIAIAAKKAKRKLIIPVANAQEGSIIKDAIIYTADHLLDVCAYLKGLKELKSSKDYFFPKEEKSFLDLSDVKGQSHAKKALMIAAAGRHSLLLMGPPGSGKTMLASRLPGLLPAITEEQALEVAAISSVSSKGFDHKNWLHIPFRSPHHSSSTAALVGGGRPPRPGEISLAHHGVLFMDELPEFGRHALESLREPLELGQITISRAAYQTTYPAQFQLIAAMNPCPCGYAGTADLCQCTQEQVKRYINKLSGPLLDRIDLQVEVPMLLPAILSTSTKNEENSAFFKQKVRQCVDKQFERQGKYNAFLNSNDFLAYCQLKRSTQKLFSEVVEKFHISARVYHRILKIARTIADLSDSLSIEENHLTEALIYRCLDKRNVYK